MTKFEEEVKRPVIGIGNSSIKPALGKAVEFYTDKVKEYHNAFSDMNKYIDHIEDKLDCANERIVLLEGTVDDLKSQLQQQALPVVPECVGNFLSSKSIFKIANGDIPDDVISWVQEQTYFVDLEKIISHLISIKVTGFTVEKPQLFYLKHIDFCKTDKHYDWFTIKHSDGPLNHLRVEKGEKPSTIDCKFTQQEINSMQTGSYEQIEVEK